METIEEQLDDLHIDKDQEQQAGDEDDEERQIDEYENDGDERKKSATDAKHKQERQKKMTLNERQQLLIKQKQLRSKVVKVITSLLPDEDQPELHQEDESEVLRKLSLLSQSCYADLTTERSLVKVCGYPFCRNRISEKFKPNQKYHIDLKSHRVYDISERRLFCSNLCYKASCFLKDQLPELPLWFRTGLDDDDEVMARQQAATIILYRDEKGSPGTQVQLSIKRE